MGSRPVEMVVPGVSQHYAKIVSLEKWPALGPGGLRAGRNGGPGRGVRRISVQGGVRLNVLTHLICTTHGQ